MSERDTDAVDTSGVEGPHGGQPVVRQGPPLSEASAVVVLLHGRGATPHGMLGLADEFGTQDVAYLAPGAAGRTWYPYAFTAPMDDNEPKLSSALALVGKTVETAVGAVGNRRVAVVGFSQGACLGSEWVARNPDRYGGLAALSGGLIGPEGTPRDYDGSLADGDDGTPVFLGCSDDDPHIPLERVHETRDVLSGLGGDVDERIYEGMGHGVNDDELSAVRGIVTALTVAEA
ncbi:MAG: alpha/beta hydrolase [Halobaculum sp.]